MPEALGLQSYIEGGTFPFPFLFIAIWDDDTDGTEFVLKKTSLLMKLIIIQKYNFRERI